MKRISALILGLLVTAVCTFPAGAGTLTTNKFLYKPSLGARGDSEKQTFDAGLDRIDARLGKEIWVGDPNYGATLQDAITAIGSAQVILRVPAGSYSGSGLTIPVNVALRPQKGCLFTGNGTMTINGPLLCGPWQCFAFTGAGKVIFAATSPQVDFYPEWWGAVGDGVTDDLAALNACRDAILWGGANNLPRGVIHWGRWYAVSSTFSVDNIDLSNNQTFTIRGSGRESCGLVGLAACAGKPVMEVVGTPRVMFSDFSLVGITSDIHVSPTPTVAPCVALLLARSTANPNSYISTFIDLGFWGFFQYGCMFNRGYSDSVFENCMTYTSPLALANASNHWSFDFTFENQSKTATFPDLLPTNATFWTSTAGAAENNKVLNCYFAGTNYRPTRAGPGTPAFMHTELHLMCGIAAWAAFLPINITAWMPGLIFSISLAMATARRRALIWLVTPKVPPILTAILL